MSNSNKPRDLFTDGFTTGDFVFEGMSRGASAQAKKVANQLLREALASAQVVYSQMSDVPAKRWCALEGNTMFKDTHTARLVAVKKIGED